MKDLEFALQMKSHQNKNNHPEAAITGVPKFLSEISTRSRMHLGSGAVDKIKEHEVTVHLMYTRARCAAFNEEPGKKKTVDRQSV